MAQRKISIGMLVAVAVMEAVLISAVLVVVHRPEWVRFAVPAGMFVTLIFLLSCPRIARQPWEVAEKGEKQIPRGLKPPRNNRKEGAFRRG